MKAVLIWTADYICFIYIFIFLYLNVYFPIEKHTSEIFGWRGKNRSQTVSTSTFLFPTKEKKENNWSLSIVQVHCLYETAKKRYERETNRTLDPPLPRPGSGTGLAKGCELYMLFRIYTLA